MLPVACCVLIGLCLDKTADVTAPSGQAPAMVPPVCTTDQILPRIRWVPIGKRNCYLDLKKSQGNPIYKIVVDLLKNTNFFRAFTDFSTIPSIYIQQFWDTVQYDKKAKSYKCQLDKQWFVLTKDTLREALQITHRRHRFHPRPDSLLHLPNEEPVLGYLKFNAKGSDQDSPAPKPAKPARKPKSTAPKARPRPSVSTLVTSAQPAPTSAPAKLQEKKRKQATETSDKPPKAKKSNYGFIGKKCSLKSVAASKAEDVPAMEPRGKYQPLPEVPGKGKAKVTKEQVSHDLLSLQKPKKKSPVDQYIFQRRTFTTTRSSRHDEPSYVELKQSEREESEKGQTGSDAGTQDEGQAGSNPDETFEGQARPDPGNAGAKVQSFPSNVVHVRSDREHMDLDVADVSPQPSTKKLDQGFTGTAYPKVQENLKLVVEEYVLLEDPASSSGTLSSLQHLSKDISFGDLFFSDKPSEVDNDKAIGETEVESMVSVTIQQDMSSIPPMTSPIIDLTSRLESPNVHQ
nr:hypothetical protein [Tanacetum cinerariifolium]